MTPAIDRLDLLVTILALAALQSLGRVSGAISETWPSAAVFVLCMAVLTFRYLSR